MTTAARPIIPQTELVSPTLKPRELSFPLPKALHTTGHVHLTFLGHCVMVHLATSTPGDSSGSLKPMGSFVYAMPDVSPLFSSSAISYQLAFEPMFDYDFCMLGSFVSFFGFSSLGSRSGVYTSFKNMKISLYHYFF